MIALAIMSLACLVAVVAAVTILAHFIGSLPAILIGAIVVVTYYWL